MMAVAAIKNIPVKMALKGDRNYIQGPDLANSVLNCFPETKIENINFSIHGFINTPNCLFSIYDAPPARRQGKFKASLTIDKQARWVEVSEQSPETDSNKRISYDETLVTKHCQREGNQIFLLKNSPYSMIETLVSMKKSLLTELIPPIDNKWIFTGIELDEYYDIRQELGIKIVHNFENKLIKSEIISANARIGTLYFSLGKP